MDTVVKSNEGVQTDEAATYGRHESPHFVSTILDHITVQLRALERLEADLVDAGVAGLTPSSCPSCA